MGTPKPNPAAIAYFAPCDEPFVLSDERQRLYRKQLVYAGTFAAGGKQFTIDRQRIDHWHRTHGQLIAAGFTPPLPLEHTVNPEANRGQLLRTEVGQDGKGRYSLFGVVKFSDAEAEKLATRTNVSVYSPPHLEYGGRTWKWPITHVALTSYPVVPALNGFEAIAASLTSGAATIGEPNMAVDWKVIQDLLGDRIPEGVELTDDNAQDVLLIVLKALIDEAEEDDSSASKPKEGEPKPGEAKPAGAPPAAPPPAAPAKQPVAASYVNMLRDNRAMKLDGLQAAGQLTKVQRDQVVKDHLSDEALALSLNGGDDGFDRIYKTLLLNQRQVNVAERTGPQAIALSHPSGGDGGNGNTNPLVAAAKKSGMKLRE